MWKEIDLYYSATVKQHEFKVTIQDSCTQVNSIQNKDVTFKLLGNRGAPVSTVSYQSTIDYTMT